MEQTVGPKHIWRCYCTKTRIPVEVVYYPFLQQFEVNTRDERLFKRLYRFLTPNCKDYEVFRSRMKRLYPQAGLKIAKFTVFA